MERIDVSPTQPVQLTLNLAERTTILLLPQRTGGSSTLLEKPRSRAFEDRSLSPSSLLSFMQDFDTFGPDDMDVYKRETNFRRDLETVKTNGVDISVVLEDAFITIDEAKAEGIKFATKPKKIRDFRRIVERMIEDVWTEPLGKSA